MIRVEVETKEYGTVITKNTYTDMEHFINNVYEHDEPFLSVDDEMYRYEQIKKAKPYISKEENND